MGSGQFLVTALSAPHPYFMNIGEALIFGLIFRVLRVEFVIGTHGSLWVVQTRRDLDIVPFHNAFGCTAIGGLVQERTPVTGGILNAHNPVLGLVIGRGGAVDVLGHDRHGVIAIHYAINHTQLCIAAPQMTLLMN